MVLIHQSPSSSRMWLDVMATLQGDVATCAIDLLGYGDSDPPERQLDLAEHAAVLLDALRQAVGDSMVLVGHHTGAVMAAQIAGDAPDEVVGLMLSGYPLYPDWGTKLDRLAPVLQPAIIGVDGDELLPIWRYVTGPLERPADTETALTIMADRLRAGRRWFTGYLQLLGADLDAVLTRTIDAAPRRPIAVVTADQDPLRGYASEVAARCGVDPVEISGTSWVSYEHPERFRAPILELVDRARTTEQAG